MKKSCHNCTHAKKRTNQLPCRRCFKAEHWEPMTNAQRIRSMTDEELAVFLGKTISGCMRHTEACEVNNTCEGCFENWLKQPYEEELHGTE